MAMTDPEMMRTALTNYKIETHLDWGRMFPQLGGKSPGETLAHIVMGVSKLRSVSEAGREAITKARCARAGITTGGEPCFYIGETE